jgi:hypothetical protein
MGEGLLLGSPNSDCRDSAAASLSSTALRHGIIFERSRKCIAIANPDPDETFGVIQRRRLLLELQLGPLWLEICSDYSARLANHSGTLD